MAHQTITDRRRQQRIVFCVAAAAFIFQFEAFMVNVSLPTMAGELDATTTEISFIVLAYLTAATVTFVPFGKLGDRMGLKRTFVGSCVALAGGTLLSALSPSLWVLVTSRAIQGIGVGGMATLAYAMIPAWLPQDKTGWGYGHLNMAAGVGMLAGVPFGSVVAQVASWRWIFFSNLPFIAFLAAFAWFNLPDDSENRETPAPFDGVGLALFSTILASSAIGFSLGFNLGWTSAPILTAVALAATAAVAMTVRQRIFKRPFFSAGLFSGPGFVPSLLVLCLVRTVLGGIIFLAPFYLAVSCRLSAVGSGLIFLAYPAAYAPVGPRAGRLADRIGSKPLVLSATLFGACACLLFRVFVENGDAAITVLFLLAMGGAMGTFFSPNHKYSMQCARDANEGEAASLMPLALNAGTVFGVSAFETVFARGFPGGAVHLKHTDFSLDPTLIALANHGFSNAFLLGFGILLAAAVIALTCYRAAEVRDHV